jgi:hypothetical protein
MRRVREAMRRPMAADRWGQTCTKNSIHMRVEIRPANQRTDPVQAEYSSRSGSSAPRWV